eukprot:gene5768-7363_t
MDDSGSLAQNAPARVTDICWSNRSNILMVVYDDGSLSAVQIETGTFRRSGDYWLSPEEDGASSHAGNNSSLQALPSLASSRIHCILPPPSRPDETQDEHVWRMEPVSKLFCIAVVDESDKGLLNEDGGGGEGSIGSLFAVIAGTPIEVKPSSSSHSRSPPSGPESDEHMSLSVQLLHVMASPGISVSWGGSACRSSKIQRNAFAALPVQATKSSLSAWPPNIKAISSPSGCLIVATVGTEVHLLSCPSRGTLLTYLSRVTVDPYSSPSSL